MSAVLKGDVFAVLPTGFGKSACFQCLPLLFDKLLPDQDPAIVVVVAPVTAIIKDQVSQILEILGYYLENFFMTAASSVNMKMYKCCAGITSV